ncbi:hypothetical protein [Streptomyces sp. NPDC002845]
MGAEQCAYLGQQDTYPRRLVGGLKLLPRRPGGTQGLPRPVGVPLGEQDSTAGAGRDRAQVRGCEVVGRLAECTGGLPGGVDVACGEDDVDVRGEGPRAPNPVALGLRRGPADGCLGVVDPALGEPQQGQTRAAAGSPNGRPRRYSSSARVKAPRSRSSSARWCWALTTAGSAVPPAIFASSRSKDLRDTAATVRNEAYELGANDDPGLGLLLAMASDDAHGTARSARPG